MVYYRKESDKLKKQIEDAKNAPFNVGEYVYVEEKYITSLYPKEGRFVDAVVESVNGDKVTLGNIMGHKSSNVVEVESKYVNHNVNNVGANPFPRMNYRDKMHDLTYSLESILFEFMNRDDDDMNYFKTPVEKINWNPYVIDHNGNKRYYQRDLVWELEDKQLLIDSIYHGLDCGKIIVRNHSFNDVKKNHNEGDSTMAWKDIVDGKQRIHTIIEFVNNEFPDRYGNYYSDLSARAKYKFIDHRLFSYAEIDEDATDEDVISVFLMVNFAGKPMSKEHIDYVENIYKDLK